MNYLAHTLLSKNRVDYQLANLLADPLKGKPWTGCTQDHRDGLIMHKLIDRYTDANPHVVRAKSRLGAGLLKGIVIDITFDHFICKHWQTFVAVEFEDFIATFYHGAMQQVKDLPPRGKTFVQRMVKYDFLHSYTAFANLEKVFDKFDQRLSPALREKEQTSDHIPELNRHAEAIEADFLQFFPELIHYFLEKSGASTNEHYFNTKLQ